MKKLLAGTVGTVLALGGLGVATATPAAAATQFVQPSCNSLYVSLEDYPEGTSVVVTLDGETVESTTFDISYAFSHDLDFSTPHDWSVDVDAPGGTDGDYSDSGTTTPCDTNPNAWADVYPDEVLGATDARPYAGALGIENPISRGVASPVLDQMAEGWGSMTVKPDQAALGKGVWKDGTWRVAITRPMVSDDLNAPRLTLGDRTVASFAVWEGGHRDVGARKAWASWVPLVIAGSPAPRSAPKAKP